jgi:LemA protein
MYQYIIILILAIIIAFIYLYNRLAKYRNAADANLSQIKVALKKRLDMIEQLVGAVKGYAEHEREVFENVSRMRANITNANPTTLNDIDNESRRIISSLVAVAEAYPELKASETVKKLMDAIVNVEDEIARHRYTFNNIVQEYNTMQDTIPTNLIAGIMNHEKLDYLEFEEEISQRPDVAVR